MADQVNREVCLPTPQNSIFFFWSLSAIRPKIFKKILLVGINVEATDFWQGKKQSILYIQNKIQRLIFFIIKLKWGPIVVRVKMGSFYFMELEKRKKMRESIIFQRNDPILSLWRLCRLMQNLNPFSLMISKIPLWWKCRFWG